LLSTEKANQLDSIAIADNELRQSFQAPTCNKLVYYVAAFASGKSSITDSTAPDIAKNKDTIGVGGSGTLIRQMFSVPIGNAEPLNPINYHCNGSPGGGGVWDCTIKQSPNPEIVNIYSLLVTKACSLNPTKECSDKIFGENYVGPASIIYPVCQTYKPMDSNYGTNNFSAEFIRIISAAATKFEIPAPVLLAYMNGIGKLQKYNFYWSISGAADLFDASAPWYGTLARCDDMNIAAQGPFDWLLFWFNDTLKDKNVETNAQNALNGISSGRGNTASRCNFLDAAYTAAAAISKFHKGCPGNWGDYQEALSSITFGSDRVGSYVTGANAMYSNDVNNPNKQIFESCKY
jgi:hypothetical protein